MVTELIVAVLPLEQPMELLQEVWPRVFAYFHVSDQAVGLTLLQVCVKLTIICLKKFSFEFTWKEINLKVSVLL